MATAAARAEARFKLLCCLGLGALEPFIGHALPATRRREVPLVDGGGSGLLVADAAGKLLHTSAEGRRLLFLATHPRMAPGTPLDRGPALPPAVTRICRNLARVVAGESSAAAPVCHHRNVWGAFTFRAHWLEGLEATPGLVGIVVTHDEPAPLRMMRAVADLPLSSRQAQVCLLLATGATYGRIAQELGISRHTAVAHGRWIYDRLDVHNRAELVGRLLGGTVAGRPAAGSRSHPVSACP